MYQKLIIRCLALISIVPGLPAGCWMVSYIFEAALGDNYDMRAYIRPMTYVFAGIGIFVVSTLVNDMMSRKIRSIDMVSSLKANE